MVNEGDDLMGLKFPRKLNFNVPILSTRKRIGDFPDDYSPDNNNQQPGRFSYDTSESRVPFSWEDVPGTPKGITAFRRSCCTPDKPHPRLPVRSSCNPTNDAADRFNAFSSSESLEAVSNENKVRILNRLDLQVIEASASRNQSPSFIIDRFLPDATALAYSYSSSTTTTTTTTSSKNLHKSSGLPAPKPAETVDCNIPPFAGRMHSPSKTCWIRRFFPWPKKHTPCGLKSPIRIVRGSSASGKI